MEVIEIPRLDKSGSAASLGQFSALTKKIEEIRTKVVALEGLPEEISETIQPMLEEIQSDVEDLKTCVEENEFVVASALNDLNDRYEALRAKVDGEPEATSLDEPEGEQISA